MARARFASVLFIALLLLALFAFTSVYAEDDASADDKDADTDSADEAPQKPAALSPAKEDIPSEKYTNVKATGALFSDDFQGGMGQWAHTEVSRYTGRFAVGEGASPIFSGDKGLIIPERARHYAISAPVPGLGDMTGKDFAVQYEVKLDSGMTCGGAYLKLPTKDFPGAAKFDSDVKYSIMFGPDKCGSTDKVHFIFQSINPVTKKYTEHHLKNPPGLATTFDKNHHLYGLYVYDNGSYALSIDNEIRKEGLLSEDFEPPVQPPEEIDDPEDKKPADWVDEKKIEDPNAKKPDDWDEDAPAEIEDESAKKPEDWLDDEPEQVPDPNAKKPENWNDEEDGEWTAPKIANPKCEKAGCGEWKRPMKANPNYKGKWTPPLIDNPKYVGEWKPKKIKNPAYYKVDKPKLLPIVAVGVEVWTMDQGVVFDDIYIGSDIKAARAYADASFMPKKSAWDKKSEEEKKKEEEESKKRAKSSKTPKNIQEASKALLDKLESAVDWLETRLTVVEDLLVRVGAEGILDKLMDIGVTKPVVVVVVLPALLVIFFLLFVTGSKKTRKRDAEAVAAQEQAKKTDAPTKDDEPAEEAPESSATDITESVSTEEAEKSVRKRRAAKVE